MKKTSLLPPLTAVQIVWARTGLFSKEKSAKIPALLSDSVRIKAESELERVLEFLKQGAEDDEREYAARVTASMDASLRSIHTVYNGRNLNFDENKRLRDTYLETMSDSVSYGFKVKDFLTGLPTISLGALGGYTLTEILSLEPFWCWVTTIAFATLGYFFGWALIAWRGKRMESLYIRQEYERTIYFCRYIEQVADILEFLYDDAHRIHTEVFGYSYFEQEGDGESAKKEEEREVIRRMLRGMLPQSCGLIHEHMQRGKILPELWPICETGRTKVIEEYCELWAKRKRKRTVSGLSEAWSHLY